jgi:hypothetical protein
MATTSEQTEDFMYGIDEEISVLISDWQNFI